MSVPSRRRLLATIGTALPAASVAGCLGAPGGDESNASSTDRPSSTNGSETDPRPIDRPEAAWSFREDEPGRRRDDCINCGGITGTPAVTEGRVYVPGQDLYALDREDGGRAWKRDTPVPVTGVSAIADGTVYAVAGVDFGMGGRKYRTYAIDAASGEVDWEYGTERSVYQSLLGVGPDSVYLATYTDGDGPDGFPVYAVDRRDGSLRWEAETGTPRNAVVHDGTVFVGSSGGLTAFDAETGDRLWRQDEDRSGHATIVDESILYRSEGGLHAFDPDGSTAWQAGTDWRGYDYAVDGGTVYAATFADGVYAVDAATGERRWHHDPGELRGLSVDRGRVYVALADAVLSIEDGDERWRWRSPWQFPRPGADGGGVFVTERRDGGTEVVSISESDGDERWRGSVADEWTRSAVVDGTLYLGGESGTLSAFPSEPVA